MSEPLCGDRRAQIAEQVKRLLLTGFRYAQQPFHHAESTATLRAEAGLAPDHGRPKRTFGFVVCWLDTLLLDKAPERWAGEQQLLARLL